MENKVKNEKAYCELEGFGVGFPEALTGKLYFSWKCSGICGRQRRYRIRVWTSGGEPWWDSQWTESEKSEAVLYRGKELEADRDYQAQVWVDAGQGEITGSRLMFSTGIAPEEWRAQWLKPCRPEAAAPMFRKRFMITKKVKRSRLYLCGLGYHEAYMNGKRIGRDLLSPAWTVYRKRVSYVVYDIQDELQEGENVCGVMLGQGWYGTMAGMDNGGLMFSAQLSLEYEDGSREWRYTAGADGWLVYSDGPVKKNSIYIGEVYDARDEMKYWNLPGSLGPDPEGWDAAIETEGPEGILVPQDLEPITCIKEMKPVTVSEPEAGVYIVDFGQNMAGILSLEIHEKRDTRVMIRYAELLDGKGRLNTANLRSAQARDIYISNGEKAVYRSRFTYHGFRYAEITGLQEPLSAGQVTAYTVRNSVKQRGTFECGNSLINKIQRMCRWTESNNLHGVPTDCPQRDERLGWLNDLTVRAEEAMYNFDLHRFFTKFLQDIRDEQGVKTGAITDTVPFVRYGSQPADPVCSSFLILGWLLYLHYGDRDTLGKHYDGFAAWTLFLDRNTRDGIVNYSYYGDWASPVSESIAESYGSGAVSMITPGLLMSTGFLHYNALLMLRFAEILGKEKDMRQWENIAEKTKEALNKTYYHEGTGTYAEGSQGANTFMVWLGIAPEPEKTVQKIAEDVKNHGIHLTTGNLCSRYILEVLTEHGFVDLAYELVTQTTYPSWGYMVEKGATTTWERWEFVEEGPLLGMASHDHPMYSTVSLWFYRYLLGINAAAPGFSEFVVSPCVPEKLDWAKGSVETVKGTVKVDWKKDRECFQIRLSVPFNAECRYRFPEQYQGRYCLNGGEWKEAGSEIRLAPGEYEIKSERVR